MNQDCHSICRAGFHTCHQTVATEGGCTCVAVKQLFRINLASWHRMKNHPEFAEPSKGDSCSHRKVGRCNG